MIWYVKRLKCKDNPPDTNLTIKGVFNHPSEANGKDIIQILLIISSTQHGVPNREIVLYSKNPTSLSMPEDYIDPSIILSKYQSNIDKIVKRITSKDLDYLLS